MKKNNTIIWCRLGVLVLVLLSVFLCGIMSMRADQSVKSIKSQNEVLTTQVFKVRDVSGSDSIARKTFGDPTGKSYVVSSVVQADIIKFVDCGTNDVSSIVLYYCQSGDLIGAEISYVSNVCPSPVRIAIFVSSYEYSTSQALVSGVSEFVSEPLRNVIDMQYVKDNSGDVVSAAILYRNEHIA